MSEIEVPIDQVQENIHQEAEHSKDKFVSRVALSSALLAGLAAVAAMLAGNHSNDAMIDQIQASNHWSHYQAKSIKSNLLSTRITLFQGLKLVVPEKDLEKLKEYQKEQEEISEQAREKEHSSSLHLRLEDILSRAVTMFQLSIAVAAISVLTKRRRFWYVSLVFGAIGIVFFIQGILPHI